MTDSEDKDVEMQGSEDGEAEEEQEQLVELKPYSH